jgi:NAD(P)-dependent dehydrogenase (short-subunit alcohol dehydrogenase family)
MSLVVLVTGASSGIGAAIATHLASCGHRVFGTSRKRGTDTFARPKAAQAKDEINAPSPDNIARLVERILAARRPAMRYTIGMVGQRIVSPLKLPAAAAP